LGGPITALRLAAPRHRRPATEIDLAPEMKFAPRDSHAVIEVWVRADPARAGPL